MAQKAAKISGNGSTTVVSYHILHYCFSILSTLSAWGGFLSVELKKEPMLFFKRLKRFGYIDCVLCTITDLTERSDLLCRLQVIHFIICSCRIVQLICVCVVILFSCMNIRLH